jgi:hypothetical protein
MLFLQFLTLIIFAVFNLNNMYIINTSRRVDHFQHETIEIIFFIIIYRLFQNKN